MADISSPTLLGNLADVTALGASGGGTFFALRWLLLWATGRADRRELQLDQEHQTLDLSWKEYRLQLEQGMKDLKDGLKTIERQNRALRLSFEHVASALIRVDPDNPALVLADRLMAAAFPDDFSLTVTRLDATHPTGTRA